MSWYSTMGFAILVSILIVCRPIFAEINCEESLHRNCDFKSLYISQSSNEYIFSDNFLIDHCSDIMEDIECKSNFLSTCGHENNHIFLLLNNGTRELFIKLCNENSHLREGYKKHIACFRNSIPKLHNCEYSSLQAAKVFHDNLTKKTGEDDDAVAYEQRKVKALCFLQKELRKCAFKEISTRCNDAAAIYLEMLFSISLDDFEDEVCYP